MVASLYKNCTNYLLPYYYFRFIFILYGRVFCLHVCMHTARVPGDLRGQKRALDLVELEVMMVVSPHVGARNATWLL